MSGNCLVAMYHYVRDVAGTRFPGLNALAPGQFDAQLDILASRRTMVDYGVFERAVLRREPLAAASALLTFDDGFRDHAEIVWSRLRERGLTGVFFIAGGAVAEPPRVLNVHKTHFLIETLGVAAFADAVLAERDRREVAVATTGLNPEASVYRYDRSAGTRDVKHLLNYELPYETSDDILGRLFAVHLGDETAFARELYLSPDQIREMSAAGMTFGFHTESHRVLARLTVAAQRRELEAGVARIRQLTGQQTVPFCFPYGHSHTYTRDTISLLDACEYSMAFTTTRRAADPMRDGRFELPRYDTRDLPPFTESLPDA